MQQYRKIVLLFFILTLCVAYKVEEMVYELPLLSKVIYVDAGHGGVDPGANYKDIYEKDINLEITQLLALELEKKGAIVYQIREDDYDLARPYAYLRKRSDLSTRVRLINESDCAIYLSVHLNASQSTNWKGAQVFYDDINPDNIKMAQVYQTSFKKYLGSRRKIKELKDLYMYKNVTKPGLLLEVGFISNTNERYILRKDYYQKKIIRSIVEATINYLT